MSEKINDTTPSHEQGEKKHTIELKEGGSIVVEETTPGTFKIIDDSMSVRNGNPTYDATDIGFQNWDDDFVNLDTDSDEFQCFGISNHLKWEDVELTPDEIKAPSLDRLKQGLLRVEIISYCPGNI